MRSPVALVLLFCAGCASGSTNVEETQPLFVGLWAQADLPPEMPESCADATIEIRADSSIIVRSGEQVITASYSVEPVGNGFSLTQTYVSDNGKPNCQGIDADYVRQNYIAEAYIEASAATLIFWPTYRGPESITFTRFSR